jgi:hypothetical protein
MYTSAEARVIASFTIIAALLLGAWVPLDQLLNSPSAVTPGVGFGRLVIALGLLGLILGELYAFLPLRYRLPFFALLSLTGENAWASWPVAYPAPMW